MYEAVKKSINQHKLKVNDDNEHIIVDCNYFFSESNYSGIEKE